MREKIKDFLRREIRGISPDLWIVILVSWSFLAVTVPAVNWASFLWLEWHFCIRTAFGTLYLMHRSVFKTSVTHFSSLVLISYTKFTRNSNSDVPLYRMKRLYIKVCILSSYLGNATITQ